MNKLSSITIDGHFDMLGDVAARRKNGENRVIPRIYLPDFKAGGVNGVVASIFVDSQYLPESAIRNALEQIAALHHEISESPDLLSLCTTASDFEAAASAGKLGIMMSFEGAEPVTSSMILKAYYQLGVRGLGLTWSRRNAAADGCDFCGSLRKGGLTPVGIELVKEAVRLGMLVDVSHLSDEGVEDIFHTTDAPFLASHSNSRTVCKTNRNLTDDQLARIAARGGVVGLNACSILVSASDCDATAGRLLSHLDHMIEVMGEDHVALGLDLCDLFLTSSSEEDLKKMPRAPFDIINRHRSLAGFLDSLRAHGYTEERVEKIAGRNWLTLYRRIFGN